MSFPETDKFIQTRLLENGVLIIGFKSLQPLNVLSFEAMKEFSKAAINAIVDDDVKACVIVSLKEGNFVAGADIKEIRSISDGEECRSFISVNHQLFYEIENCHKPFVSAIEGVCLGGGLELALACHWRVASDHVKTYFALPEVMLGIIPGLGGTQRLPKLIGLAPALAMITTGKNIYPYIALKMGLIDDLVRHVGRSDMSIDNIEKWPYVSVAIQRALELTTQKKQRKLKLWPRLSGKPGIKNIVFAQTKRLIIQKTKGHYPAPLAALRAVKKGFCCNTLQASKKYEMPEILKLIPSPTSKNLIDILLTSQSLSRSRSDKLLIPSRDTLGVLGAGLMGSQIADNLSASGFDVNLKDIKKEFLEKGMHRVLETEKIELAKRRISKAEHDRRLLRIHPTLDFKEFSRTSLVIEAAAEILSVKQSLLEEFENIADEHAIFATNTSSFMVSEITARTRHKERCIAMHFFNPLRAMKLVEIGVTDSTSQQTINAVTELARSMGKVPLIVKDCPGFLVNRILSRYLIEAIIMVAEGIEINKIDLAAKNFGMAIDSGRTMGPLELIDYIGMGTATHVIKSLKKLGPRIEDHLFVYDLVPQDKGPLNFWKNGEPNAEIYELLKAKYNFMPKRLSEKEITDRLILPMIDESIRCLAEGIVQDSGHLDTAMVLATGFPAFTGGPMRWAHAQGIDKVKDRLKELSEKEGSRFESYDGVKIHIQI